MSEKLVERYRSHGLTGCLFFAAQPTLQRGIEEQTKIHFSSKIDIYISSEKHLIKYMYTTVYVYTISQ